MLGLYLYRYANLSMPSEFLIWNKISVETFSFKFSPGPVEKLKANSEAALPLPQPQLFEDTRSSYGHSDMSVLLERSSIHWRGGKALGFTSLLHIGVSRF